MTGTGKFLYVADLGLLSNTAANFIVLAAFLGLSLLLLIATVIIRRATNYQKIDHEGNPVELDSPGANLESPDNNVDRVNVTTDTTGSSLLLRFANLMESLFSNFNLFYLNRLIYFNYTALILFSFAQLTAFTTNSTINLASSLLAIAALLFLLIYAVKAGLQEHKYWFLYGRKTLIAGAIVISMKNAIYGIGIISVCNFTAAILILTHKIEQYRVETWFHAACELIQLLILVVLSLLIMAGEGRFTTIKLGIAWLIVTAVIALLFVYLAHASLEAALYYCLHFKGVDYRSEWVSNETSSTENGSDSESNTNSLK